jgi:hypothetical protein
MLLWSRYRCGQFASRALAASKGVIVNVEAVFGCASKKDGKVSLTAVAENEKKYAEHFKWTPWGNIEMGILNESALAAFEPGALYKVTFEMVKRAPEFLGPSNSQGLPMVTDDRNSQESNFAVVMSGCDGTGTMSHADLAKALDPTYPTNAAGDVDPTLSDD